MTVAVLIGAYVGHDNVLELENLEKMRMLKNQENFLLVQQRKYF